MREPRNTAKRTFLSALTALAMMTAVIGSAAAPIRTRFPVNAEELTAPPMPTDPIQTTPTPPVTPNGEMTNPPMPGMTTTTTTTASTAVGGEMTNPPMPGMTTTTTTTASTAAGGEMTNPPMPGMTTTTTTTASTAAGGEMTNPPMPGMTTTTTTTASTAAGGEMTNPPMPGMTTTTTTTASTAAGGEMTNPPMPGMTTTSGSTTTTTSASTTTTEDTMTNPPMPGMTTTSGSTTTTTSTQTTGTTTSASTTTTEDTMTNPPMSGMTTTSSSTTTTTTTESSSETTTTTTKPSSETTTTTTKPSSETTTTTTKPSSETTTTTTKPSSETTTTTTESSSGTTTTTTKPSGETTTTTTKPSSETTTTTTEPSGETTTTTTEPSGETTTTPPESSDDTTTTTTESSTETPPAESSTETTPTEPAPTVYLRPSDQLKTNEQGERYAVDENGKILTGYFTLAPNFQMGDVTGDGVINAEDAALILLAAAEQGSTGTPAEQYLIDNNKAFLTDKEKAKVFADADESGMIDASDAAMLLIYAAELGADPSLPALGYGVYVANADGIIQTGLFKDETTGKTYWPDEGGRLRTGWQTIQREQGETAVFFHKSGEMAVNQWITDQTGRTIWVTEDGSKLVNSFLDTEEGRVYLDPDGSRAVGIREVEGLGYYFNTSGIMQKGMVVLGDMTCFADENGVLTTGLADIDNVTYYFDPETYGMVTDQWLTLEDGTRYFGAAGAMLRGWQIIGADTYYLGTDGIKLTGMTKVEDKTYFLDENGVRRAGWREVDGKRYYFLPVGCHMATGWQTINNIRYYFYMDGVMASDTEIEGQKIQANGYAMSDQLCEATVKIQAGLKEYGTTPDEIFDYMRSTNRYKKTEATRTLDQLNEAGWTSLVHYACSNYYTVCYYMAAKMDYILKLSGYTCRIVYATHGSGDHYWNQVLIDGVWVNYDPTNNLKAYTWDKMIAYGDYVLLDYVDPKYV